MEAPIKEEVPVTLRTAVRRFATQLAADGKSPLTVRVYRSELERLFAALGPRVPVRRIRPATLAKYLTSDACRLSPDGQPRSARTLNRTKTAIRLLFAYLVGAGALKESPARLLQNARLDAPLPVTLTEREERQFLHALAAEAGESEVGKRDRVLFTLLLKSGMRLSAALALNVDDLDLRNAVALTNGKHARVQRVFLARDVVRLLGAHLKRTGITAGPVFLGRGGRLSARQVQFRFHRYIDLAGIDRPVTVHSLRHSFATRLRQRTGDLQIVQAALGHRDIASTQVYCQLAEEEIRRAVAS
jgi:integrase/recombinase XerD